MTYTFNELSDLLDAVNCKRDIKEIEDYIFANLRKYPLTDLRSLTQSIDLMKAIY